MAKRSGCNWHRLAASLLGTALMLAGSAILAAGYDVLGNFEETPWEEDLVPPPPAFDGNKLIELDMPVGTSVKVGVAADSIRISPESGVVRYIMVARGPTARNVSYEGIHCAGDSFRVYARKIQGQPWVQEDHSEWTPMSGQGGIQARYPYQLAKNGMCMGRTTPDSVPAIIRDLKSGRDSLYR